MSRLLPPNALPMGLGCSRLGSVNGATWDDSLAVLRRALNEGVRFFDTSNIYGQGDSERLLAEALAGHDDCVISSKAGKYLRWHRRILVPLKAVLRESTRRSPNVSKQVATARAKPMPARWDGALLTRSLEDSLRRLKRERIDVFLLHSPPVGVIHDGEAMSALELARTAGKIGVVGVSVDDAETASACLRDDRVRVLQVPLRPGSLDFHEVVTKAAQAGVSVVAREILGGAAAIAGHHDSRNVARTRIIDVVRDPQISVPLIGATRIDTLAASIEAVQEAIR